MGRKNSKTVSAGENEMLALLREVAASPRRDNSCYHQAMAEARQAFTAAEDALGGPVTVRMKAKKRKNGKYSVKWVFSRAG